MVSGEMVSEALRWSLALASMTDRQSPPQNAYLNSPSHHLTTHPMLGLYQAFAGVDPTYASFHAPMGGRGRPRFSRSVTPA
jgi:hypothetical protein